MAITAFAEKKSENQETLVVETPVVGCDGGGGALGHPMIYLNMGDERQATCPYCSRHFELAEGVKAGGH